VRIGIEDDERVLGGGVAAREREYPGILVGSARTVRRPEHLLIPFLKRRVALAQSGEALDPLEEIALRAVAAWPEVLAVRRVVSTGEALLGSIIDAGNAVLSELEEEGILERRNRVCFERRDPGSRVEESRDIVIVQEVDERLRRRQPGAAHRGLRAVV